MVNVGALNKVTLYVYLPDMSDYLDCTSRLMTYSLKQRRGALDSFGAKIAGVTGDNRQYFRRNCIALLYVGLRDSDDPTARIVLEEPKFNEDYTVDISGFQSSGTSDTSPYRRLNNCSTGKTSYTEISAATIAADICSGIISYVLVGTTPVSMNLNYENSLKEINRLASLSNQEWWITHTKTIDVLQMDTMKGRQTSQITFNQSGSGGNVWSLEAADEVKTNCNDAIILGSGSGMDQMMTEIYEASGVYTLLNGALDTRLASDVTSSGLSLTVTHTQANTQMGAGGTNYYIKIDSEIMEVDSYVGTTITIAANGRGKEGTTAAAHKAGSDVIYWRSDTAGAASTITITVDDTTPTIFGVDKDFTGTTKIRIGSEIINVGNPVASATTMTGCVRSSGGSTWYHGNDIYVFQYTDGSGTYTPTEPKSGSLILTNGLFTRSYQNNSATHFNELDKLGQDIIITSHQLMPRLTVSVMDPFDLLDTNANAPIVVGDLVTVQDDLDNVDLDQTGAASSTYRIYALTLSYDYGRMKLEYELENQRLTYSEEVTEGIGIDYQRPTREFAENLNDYLYVSSDGKVVLDSNYGDVEIEAADDIILDAADDIKCYPSDDFIINFSTDTSATGFYVKNNSGSTLFSVLGDGTITGISVYWDRETSPNRLEANTPGDRIRLFDAGEVDYIDMYHNGTNAYLYSSSGDWILTALDDDARFNAKDEIWLRPGFDGSSVTTTGTPDMYIRMPTDHDANDTNNPSTYVWFEDRNGDAMMTVAVTNTTDGVPYIRMYHDARTDGDFRLIGTLTVGGGVDLQVYHDGSNGYVDSLTNDLYLRSINDDIRIIASDDLELTASGDDVLITAENDVSITADKVYGPTYDPPVLINGITYAIPCIEGVLSTVEYIDSFTTDNNGCFKFELGLDKWPYESKEWLFLHYVNTQSIKAFASAREMAVICANNNGSEILVRTDKPNISFNLMLKALTKTADETSLRTKNQDLRGAIDATTGKWLRKHDDKWLSKEEYAKEKTKESKS